MNKKLTHSEAGKLGAIAAAEINAERARIRQEDYNNNPKFCKYCKTIIPYDKRYNDYCNQSCSAKLLNINRGFVLVEDKEYICLFCKKAFKAKGMCEHKYCSRTCMINFWWEETKNQVISDGYDLSSKHQVAKKILIEQSCGACQICGLSTWNGQPMPLVLDHINGNPYDNYLCNLRVICNNCDALTDTYKGKNKGNGRVKRRERYRLGKSY